MPTHLAARHSCRRLIALIAVGAWVLQAFVAGFANAHALGAPDAAIGIICHGASGAGSDEDSAPAGVPDVDRAGQICCLFCAAAALVNVKAPSILVRMPLRPVAAAPVFSSRDIVIARAVVRAGRSQAPPSRA